MVLSRRRIGFLLTTLGLVATLVLVLDAASARELVIGGLCENCELVFEGLPERLDSRARIAPENEPGEALILEGTIRTLEGAPAAGVIVYAYHTNHGGLYPRANTLHGRLRGWARTDAAGNYHFDTIRPGAYPEQRIPQHIHMHLIEPGRGTYWIDDVHFEDDPLLTPAIRRGMGHGRGGGGIVQPAKDATGVWRVRRDITLGEGIPGYGAPNRGS